MSRKEILKQQISEHDYEIKKALAVVAEKRKSKKVFVSELREIIAAEKLKEDQERKAISTIKASERNNRIKNESFEMFALFCRGVKKSDIARQFRISPNHVRNRLWKVYRHIMHPSFNRNDYSQLNGLKVDFSALKDRDSFREFITSSNQTPPETS